MSRIKTLQDLFKRYRRPGDLVFAVFFMLFALFLLANLGTQTEWVKRTQLVAQPAFWPAVAVWGMAIFGALHLASSFISPRIPGRLAEVTFWLRSLEYVAWFLVYVLLVPQLGYLLSTVAFAVILTFRLGYRGGRMLGFAALTALAIVLLFKSFLQVKVPGGAIYEYLPGAMRSFMLTYF
ncbi:Tripartite tricarboxylate transporter TctB family protein [Salinihabitans flavidus]|uniref:Tripartite tricarboxylate transporter TctB family protein n=1 Tax=Salinihabitans flavidus TaxID=569882 RepID=A0A1H8U3Y9_9RHOB|nr:tripartite tricarboxylate transporter TctB family protein [Salinihabitans flavidus]SEO97776.1 Tripartite tricarboxylate transporter TctB family protein [Salinihabitans flavidus]